MSRTVPQATSSPARAFLTAVFPVWPVLMMAVLHVVLTTAAEAVRSRPE